jgi:hypothetical protein
MELGYKRLQPTLLFHLLQLFSLQARLLPAQAAAVAARAGDCSTGEASALFQEMHAAAKKTIRRAVRRAEEAEAAKGAGSAGSPEAATAWLMLKGPERESAARAAVEATAMARQSASNKLHAMLDGSGGLRHATATGTCGN